MVVSQASPRLFTGTASTHGATPSQLEAMGPPTQISGEQGEDWTSVSDQTARKRIQNRIAQRNYRKNLKRRIDFLEKQNLELAAASLSRHDLHHQRENILDEGRFSGVLQDMVSRLPEEEYPTPSTIQYPYSASSSQHGNGMAFPRPFSRANQSHPRIGSYEEIANGSNNFSGLAFANQNYATTPVSPSQFTPSGFGLDYKTKFLATSKQSSQEDPALLRSPLNDKAGMYIDNTDSRPTSTCSTSLPCYSPFHDESSSIRGVSNSETTASPSDSPRQMITDFDFSSDHGTETNLKEDSTLHADTPLDRSTLHRNNSVSSHSTDHFSQNRIPLERLNLKPQSPQPDASLDDKIDFILECSGMAGFATFDAIVSAYYTADFDDSAIASNAQRLSRKRHLPVVLSELSKASTNWTDWEAQGYRDEVFKSAEAILLVEKKDGDLQDMLEEDPEPRKVKMVQRSLQAKLPNLWAIVTNLLSDDLGISQYDRSQLTLAIVLLLCSAGVVPLEVIGKWTKFLLKRKKETM